jgi:DNA-directed RNA polymerase subunit RPC12/RpoP
MLYICGGMAKFESNKNRVSRKDYSHSPLNFAKTRLFCCLCFVFPWLILFGTDCGAEIEIKPKDVIRCRECGHRILYKKRTKRSKQIVTISALIVASHSIRSKINYEQNKLKDSNQQELQLL